MVWELGSAIIMTAMARIYRWSTGKPIKRKHEIAFWATGIIGLTAMLIIMRFGLIKPIQEDLAGQRAIPPNLHCLFVQGATCTSFNGSPPSVFYQLKVVNSGGPSIAWKWNLKITLTTGQVMNMDATENPFTQTFMNPQTKEFVSRFEPTAYLPNILLENPLQPGAGKTGWVVFKVDQASDDDLQRIGNKFILKFEDCNGIETSITNTLTEKGGILHKSL